MFFDPMYFVFIIPAVLLGFWAQFKVKSNFKKYSKVRASSGVSGAAAARQMLDNAGLHHVGIERATGFLSDHYDPRQKVLRLSPGVHDGQSVASLGVACHEAGHAVQDAKHYAPLVLRNGIVPLAGFGSQFSFMLIFGGAIMGAFAPKLSMFLVLGGVILFSTVVLFQVVNLPVEFDASSRAKKMLPQLGLIHGPEEQKGVDKVLNAAALTYVAATLSAVLTLLYYLFLLFGRRD